MSAVLAFASILIGVIVPKFGEMFAQRGASLPTLTRVLMEVGLSVRSYWWAYFIGAGGIGVAAYSAGRSTMGRRTLDAVAHRIPYMAHSARLGVSRFSRVLGIAFRPGSVSLKRCNSRARRRGGSSSWRRSREWCPTFAQGPA